MKVLSPFPFSHLGPSDKQLHGMGVAWLQGLHQRDGAGLLFQLSLFQVWGREACKEHKKKTFQKCTTPFEPFITTRT